MWSTGRPARRCRWNAVAVLPNAVLQSGQFTLRYTNYATWCVHPASALEKAFAEKTLKFVMDYELWLRLASQGSQFRNLPRPIGIDRHQPDRKVYRLGKRWAVETNELHRRYGMHTGLDARLYGVPLVLSSDYKVSVPFMTIERSIQPAFPMRSTV